MSDIKTCIDCGQVAEITMVPAVKLADGRIFIKGREPEDAVIVYETETRRIICGCKPEYPYRHP